MNKVENGEDALPVFKILIAALVWPWQLRAHLAIALALPIAIFLLLNVADVYYHGSLLFSLGRFVAYALAFAVFAVNCHRLFLLGADSVPRRMAIVWSQRETDFIRWSIVLWAPGLILLVAMLSVFATSSISPESAKYIFYAAYLPQLYIWSRFAVILPAVALDRVANISWAWRLSRGNVTRLFFALNLVPWAFANAIDLGEQRSFVAAVFETAGQTAGLLVEVAILSFSSRHLISRTPRRR